MHGVYIGRLAGWQPSGEEDYDEKNGRDHAKRHGIVLASAVKACQEQPRRCHANHYRHTTRFDLCVAIVSFLSALVFSIKVRNE
jgi:hypothetical protein